MCHPIYIQLREALFTVFREWPCLSFERVSTTLLKSDLGIGLDLRVGFQILDSLYRHLRSNGTKKQEARVAQKAKKRIAD